MKKIILTIVIVIVVVLVLITIGAVIFIVAGNRYRASTINDTATTTQSAPVIPAQAPSTTSSWGTYATSTFTVKYPDSFTLVPASLYIPAPGTYPHVGQKLISVSQAKQIGTLNCMMDVDSGPAVTCDPGSFEGIYIIPINDSVTNLTKGLSSGLSSNLISQVTVAGKSSEKFSHSLGGKNDDYYFIPLTSNQTLLIVRDYHNNGSMDVATFNSILNTLVITN